MIIWINPFVPNASFLYPLKTSENRKFFWCEKMVKSQKEKYFFTLVLFYYFQTEKQHQENKKISIKKTTIWLYQLTEKLLLLQKVKFSGNKYSWDSVLHYFLSVLHYLFSMLNRQYCKGHRDSRSRNLTLSRKDFDDIFPMVWHQYHTLIYHFYNFSS